MADAVSLAMNISGALAGAPRNTAYSYCTSLGTPMVQQAGPKPAWACDGSTASGPWTRTDCSGWVSWLLNATAPAAYNAVAAFRTADFAEDPCDWPRAYIYYRYAIDNPQGAFSIVPVAEAQPGDIIVYALDGYASATGFNPAHPPVGGDTGHIMLVVGAAQPMPAGLNKAGGLPPGASAWIVPVSDSSCVGHMSYGDYTDHRDYHTQPECPSCGKPDPDKVGGVGIGVMGFAGDGRFCFDPSSSGFHWNPAGADSNRGNQPALAVLRINPAFAG